MAHPISSNIWDHLVCSYCGSQLAQTPNGAECRNCHLTYAYTDSGSLDLRLQRPKGYELNFELGTPLLPEQGFKFAPLTMNDEPEVNFSDQSVPRHLSKEILSYFPKAKSENSLMLDLGCGAAIHKGVCERAGYEWVGVDYDSREAQILADAHALPFDDDTFEAILCVTVLQYIRFPFVMMREACRVLKPHGKIIGTVAFLEPSHGTSFYHHTNLGAFNVLQYGGFTVEKLAPSHSWDVFIALANMGLFYRMPSMVSQSMVLPLRALHKLWWWAGGLVTGRELEEVRLRNFTGSFTFIASKNAP